MNKRWLAGIVTVVVLLIGLRLFVGVVDWFVTGQEYRSPLRVETADPTPRVQGLADEEAARAQKELEKSREEAQYRRLLLAEGGRVAVWILAQLHLLLAAFILALPLFALIVEFVGYEKGDERYAGLARELSRLLSASFSLTVILGAFMVLTLALLYPELLSYLLSAILAPYAGLILLEALLLYGYCHGWGWLGPRVHLSLGLMLAVVGLAIMLVADARLTAGAMADWMPLGIHRIVANFAFAGSIVGAYAAFRFLQADGDEERASFDRMGHAGSLTAIGAFLVPLFAGFWVAPEILDFARSVGVPIMGGAFAWLFMLQAALIGNLLLAACYYLWLGVGRIEGTAPYRKLIKYLLIAIALCSAIWATPRSILGAVSEVQTLGGPSSPGLLGVLSAKSTAVNVLILSSFMGLLLYRRAGGRAAHAPKSVLGRAQFGVFAAASAILVLWGAYGYFVDAATRVRFYGPQVVFVLVALGLITVLDLMLHSSTERSGQAHWGKIPKMAQYALIFLAVSFAWLMGLTGYVRSGYGLIRESPPDVLTSSLGFATRTVSATVLIFFLIIGVVFWLAGLSGRPAGRPRALRVRGLLRIVLLVVGTTLLYAYIGRLLPQPIVEPTEQASITASAAIHVRDS